MPAKDDIMDNSTLVVLDVETIHPNWDPPEDDPKKFPPLTYHEPVVISYLVVDQMRDTFCLDHWFPTVESLKNFLPFLKETIDGNLLITWAGRNFDMPLLSLHAIKNGVPWDWWWSYRQRFPNYKNPLKHIDMKDQLSDYGYNSVGLNDMSKFLGNVGKTEIDGSKINTLWKKEENRSKIIKYCDEDVINTFLIYLDWSRCFGTMEEDTYNRMTLTVKKIVKEKQLSVFVTNEKKERKKK